jgi:RNA polymerase sigma-70 factor (ECF subfamily)
VNVGSVYPKTEGLEMDRHTGHDIITGFILENRDSLYRLAYSYVRNREDALDIMEDAICKALSRARSLNNPAVVRAWTYRIVVNSALDFLRKRRRDLYLESDMLESETDKYQDFDLQSAIASLSTRNRTIILLRFYEDIKIEEVAEIMGENVNTIKTALYSSLKRLPGLEQ